MKIGKNVPLMKTAIFINVSILFSKTHGMPLEKYECLSLDPCNKYDNDQYKLSVSLHLEVKLEKLFVSLLTDLNLPTLLA